MSFAFSTCNKDVYHEFEDALVNAHAQRVLLFAAAANSGGKLAVHIQLLIRTLLPFIRPIYMIIVRYLAPRRYLTIFTW